MKRWMRGGLLSFLACMCALMTGMTVRATEAEEDRIKNGIFAGEVDLSGMSPEEAIAAVNAYVEKLKDIEITLVTSGDEKITVPAGDFGLSWANQELVQEALTVGKNGNVIERYKVMKDLEHENLVYPVQLSFNLKDIRKVVEEKCTGYDVEAVNWGLTRVDGEFQIVDGNNGYALDVDASVDKVNLFLEEEWNQEACAISLVVEATEPKGTREELAQVKDVLGSYTTYYYDSDANRAANIATGSDHINGTILYPGEEFSTCDAVMPFTVENGYYSAGSYEAGRLVKSLGGGVCQVSTTFYNAVLLAELEVVERFNHSMVVTYVEPSTDAAVNGSKTKDFIIKNNLEHPIYIESVTEGKSITVTIYGKETRDPNREVRYESKVLEVIYPPGEVITPDEGKPLGDITVSGAFVGYKAQLWKIVLEDGKEVSRTQVNTSSYRMVPRTAVVGVATEDPAAYEQIMAAIGTGSIDHVKNVTAMLLAPPPAPEGENAEQ